MNNVQVLDCTLRDGGLGLEDSKKNELSSLRFQEEDRKKVALKLTDSNIDIIELGAIEITEEDKTGFCIYPDIQSISKNKPRKKNERQMFAALYRGPDTPIEDIPEWNENLVEAVRVIIRYSELKKSLDFCAALSKKGYKVFVQPMLTMRYLDEEIELLISESNKMNAYALYFVDSYGYMLDNDVKLLFDKINNNLNKNIRIGFHAHNNMNLAFSNVLHFIRLAGDRKIIIDSCITGMGQGAGNLQTELIIGYWVQNGLIKYKFDSVLECCEIIEKYLADTLWGYSVTRLIPALHKCAYKYSIALRNKYNLSYMDIDKVLKGMPKELKQRYTKENTEKYLRQLGYLK